MVTHFKVWSCFLSYVHDLRTKTGLALSKFLIYLFFIWKCGGKNKKWRVKLVDLLLSLFKKQKKFHKIFLLKKKNRKQNFTKGKRKHWRNLRQLTWQNFFPHQFSSHKHRRENNLDHTWTFTLKHVEQPNSCHFVHKNCITINQLSN